jgi:hypothetical protein
MQASGEYPNSDEETEAHVRIVGEIGHDERQIGRGEGFLVGIIATVTVYLFERLFF